MSLLNRQAWLEGAAFLSIAAGVAAQENADHEPVSALAAVVAKASFIPEATAKDVVDTKPAIRGVNCDLNGALFEDVRRNIAYVIARYPNFRGHYCSSAVVLSVPEKERGPKFDPVSVYMLTCRHSIGRFLTDDKGARSVDFSNDVSVLISVSPHDKKVIEQPCTVQYEDMKQRPLSEIADLALLSFKHDGYHYPNGFPLYSGSDGSLWLKDVTLAGRPRGAAPRIVISSISNIKNIDSDLVYSGKLHNLISDYPVYFGHSGGAAIVHEYGSTVTSLEDVRSSIAGITFGNCVGGENNDEAVNTLIVPPEDIRVFLVSLGILAASPKKVEVAATPAK